MAAIRVAETLCPQAFQRQRELRIARGEPHQRTPRLAECRSPQKATQVFRRRGIGSRKRRPSATGAANLPARAIERRQFLQAAIDRTARDSGRPRHSARDARIRPSAPPPPRCAVHFRIGTNLTTSASVLIYMSLLRLYSHRTEVLMSASAKADAVTSKVTDANFDADVLRSNEPVVVDFWAEWCGPCRMIAPALEEIAVEMKGRVKVAKLNVDENPEVAGKYGIRSIPTLMVFKDGKHVATKTGAGPKSELSRWISGAV